MIKNVFVHDRIIHLGGAEMILKELLSNYADTDSVIFTLFSKKSTFDGYKVITALPPKINKWFIQGSTSNWKLVRRLMDYRNMMPLYPFLIRLLRQKIKKYTPETVIVSSFATAKNIKNKSLKCTKAILYCHSPMQYIWENYDEYCQKLGLIKKLIFIICSKYLRIRDTRKILYDEVYTNSYYTKSCVKKAYGWTECKVWYPSLPEEFTNTKALKEPFSYYIFVGRVVKFVRELDKIITMCNTLHLPLIIMGSGPDEIELKELAGPTITFIGHIKDIHEKATIIKQAKGMINLAKESCGIATMEALSLGVPVLGYNQGGTAELVHNENLGILVDTKQIDRLVNILQKFHQQSFDRSLIKKNFLEFYNNNRFTIT